ncbi:MAG: hypothetical protein LBT52_02610 [Clostridiales Family XIII bacterium]|jgi:hypothetical protein|nr:hypothetical protein [Clostridiales Family XIII bacterium]
MSKNIFAPAIESGQRIFALEGEHDKDTLIFSDEERVMRLVTFGIGDIRIVRVTAYIDSMFVFRG